MEIGGYDTIFVTNEPHVLATKIMKLLRFEIMEFVEGYDFFYYKDQVAKDSWDEGVNPLEDTMVYFMIRENELTVCTDQGLTYRIRECFSEYEKGQ
jgi:hypothetical protein